MPELPEVEVTRRGIDEPLRGAEVLAVRLGKALRWPLGVAPQALLGARVLPVQRRGKYLWLPLLGGCGGGLLLHLGMSGSLALHPAAPAPGPHDHFDLVTSHGTLRLTDPRRFGAVVWSPSTADPPAATLLAALGAEPFDATLTPQSFHAALQRHRTPIKAMLLSGRIVVGAGNIYACEALHQAGIHPATPCRRIGPLRAARLLQALRETLAQAIELGGSTLRDFRDAHGMNGEFQHHARVYGRAGEPCPRCGAAVRRVVQAQRATYFCAACQRP
ncbi:MULTISPECIES: bifunctional DNA-formamidopyrimidine glycosylase/DNA-(apurinic or apyrimidinic site) lyase [Rubrivivax]|uniref:Formamidopyrimidine-DNA glycosylase n=1 Tax=Rubrivivax benzoatilyticus TaxID=316997 RepID=A0ABX0HUK7_9BURK|nr:MULTISPECIES: bifunctional DNA-formamidopyrimidine glycosylase/DNA-(apurinic or apyrimidinic site) lyase [Rubrivivax]MCD0418657.1 bifunctional DNA-formamidopyrimidine glycosylase/DNA-(apurinic or apyrimidinic site) lyase [Rubrivivax sp. JA1024]EGJ11751.1 formamidopyrimidine/5-formyluracil/ 5-hydroxymethyluracil DNA glycosylase [Rubrivivax benzoatilyticus JA2 = ATCC BAA-35]MCC9598649.1 bifunctional DNA-formamidopyrimidine glycosylase/DNA-(apurinic or apyrimidinic site) lyase [Rubrivivax sp. JA